MAKRLNNTTLKIKFYQKLQSGNRQSSESPRRWRWAVAMVHHGFSTAEDLKKVSVVPAGEHQVKQLSSSQSSSSNITLYMLPWRR